MELDLIKVYLNSPNSQERLQAIRELKAYDSDIAVPLLKSKISDTEFIVRSFVAMGLGKKRTNEGFEALVELLTGDRDPNVRAEAANSLSLFGQISLAQLVETFKRDNHWLVRRSILAAVTEMNSPEQLFVLCTYGILDEDLTTKEVSIDCLSLLVGTTMEKAALEQLLPLTTDKWWRSRLRVAIALSKFNQPKAKEALQLLKQDEDYRVVGAVLENELKDYKE